MLFNSIDFAIFLPIVFILYWFIFNKNIKVQNALVFLSSIVFYGWWDYRFLSLILFSTLLDYFVGIKIEQSKKEINRKLFLWLSIVVNLGFLGFFKYFNFFISSFSEAFSVLGYGFKYDTLKIILPVGISFYTFQTLSYSIDVYRKQLKPTKDFIAFGAYVTFFPQLVAGPIERAINLLPQFYIKRAFNKNIAINGLRQILWGLFKKIVIADNCAEYANLIFNNSDQYSGSTLLIGAVFFAFQIYCDFSGYSDIAIGIARLFGFQLMQNFAFPYFSRDIAEFWRRWHISLSTWFRDYLYIPLGGSKGGLYSKIRNTFIIFIVSGFWHGANWTFIIWGALNALYFLPLLLRKKNRNNLEIVAKGKFFPSFKEFSFMLFTFLITVFAWIFFRAKDVTHAFLYIRDIFSIKLLSVPEVMPLSLLGLLVFFIFIEWLGREQTHALEFKTFKLNRLFRWSFYFLIIILIDMFEGGSQDFIYFQF